MSPDLFVFTIASDVSKAHRLISTAHKNNLPIEVCEKTTWTGYADKLTCMLMLLSLESMAPEDYVIFVDAYDVLCYADSQEIIQKFEEMECDLLIGAELSCYPAENQLMYDYVYQEQHLLPATNYRYVNSGGYMGTKKALLDMLQWKPFDEIYELCELGGDQNYVTQYFLEHVLINPRIRLDHKQQMFQNLHKVELSECSFRQGRFHNNVLGTWPCFVHFNGYNAYDFQMIHQETGVSEHIMDACLALAEAPGETYWKIPYRVPYVLVYQGIEVTNLPQLHKSLR